MEEYLTLTQASVKSGFSIWKLRKLIDSGQLSGTRTPKGDRVVELADLQRFTAEQPFQQPHH